MTIRGRLTRLRPRFSLWAMLVLITVAAIPLGYVVQRRSWNLRRLAAYERLVAKEFHLAPEIFDEMAPAPVTPMPPTTFQKWWRGISLEDGAPRVREVIYHQSKFDNTPGPNAVDDDLKLLAAFPEIERVELQSADNLTDHGLASVIALPRLRDLKLNHLPLVEGEFLHLGPKRTSLEILFLGRADRLKGKHLRSLSNYSSLKSIHFFRCPQLDDNELSGVELPQSVVELRIRYCAIGDESVERWLKSLKLNYLLIDARVTRKIVETIAQEQSLTHIQLTTPPFLPEDAEILRSRLRLEKCLLEEALQKN